MTTDAPDDPDERSTAGDAHFAFERDVIAPLVRRRRYEEAALLLERRLEQATCPFVRAFIFQSLLMMRWRQGRRADSLGWAIRYTEEQPDEPLAWIGRALWHLTFGRNSPPSAAELAEGLEYSDRALAVAYRTDTWVRHVLFDRGRIANAAGRHDVIEDVMRALIEDAPKTRDVETPMIETDFLDDLPPGAIDPDLRARFFAAMRSAVRHRPQMRDGSDG